MKFSNGNWIMRENVTSFSPNKVYESIVSETSVRLMVPSSEIRHRGDTLGGVVFDIELSSPMEDVLKVRLSHFSGTDDAGPHFDLVENTLQKLTVQEDENLLKVQSGNLQAVINLSEQWHMSFTGPQGELTHTGFRNMGYMLLDNQHKSHSSMEATADQTQWTTYLEGKKPFIREQLNISVDELIYGLGERFTPFIKNGQAVDIWNEDGGTSSEQSYKNIPFYLSSRGYGVFVNHPEKVSFEVGSEKVSKVQFSVPGEYLEYYIIGGPTPKEVLANYTSLTGKPALPPSWTFGLWLTTSFTTDYDEATVTSFVDGMLEREIPLHTFHFDCFWMKAFNWCDFEWDKDVFPDPVGMLTRLKAKGLHICVWINPFIAQQSPLFYEGKAGGYLLEKPDGGVWQWDTWQSGMALVDFTNPDASAWYASKLDALIDMGVDSFKTDFGERIPVDVVYHDGSDPLKMHNYYTYLYNEVVFGLLEKRLGKGKAAVFARSATVGSQKFPVHWGGDCSSIYESMAESLRGGLSLTMSGFGFWSHDIGGFESTSTPDVYKRWAAFGLLSSHSRLHGSSSYRVPWAYDEESVDVVRFFSRLKCTLMPYIFTGAVQTVATGVSLMRAMVVEFPEDRSCHYLDRQYMFGDNLLVAPIFNEQGEVNYYLPEGKWTNILDNRQVKGGRYVKEQHGYLSLPLMARPNSIIPMGYEATKPDYVYNKNVCYHVFELDNGVEAVCEIHEEGKTNPSELMTRLSVIKEAEQLTISLTTHITGQDLDLSSCSILLRNMTVSQFIDSETIQLSQHEFGTLVESASATNVITLRLK